MVPVDQQGMPAYHVNYQGAQSLPSYMQPMPVATNPQPGTPIAYPPPPQMVSSPPYPVDPSAPHMQQSVGIYPISPQQPVQVFPPPPSQGQQQPVQVYPSPQGQQQPVQVYPPPPSQGQQQPVQVFPPPPSQGQQQPVQVFPTHPQELTTPSPQTSSSGILQSPDASYFADNGNVVVPSPYPRPQQPRGKPIEISVDKDESSTKKKSTMVGLGVGAAALVLTGGLLIPAIAGAAVYNTIKKGDRTRFIAYPNSYVYELRSAIGKKFNIQPELIHLSRKGVVFDDNELLQKYVTKKKVTLTMMVCDIPVPGSNYHLPYGSVYPEPWTVTTQD